MTDCQKSGIVDLCCYGAILIVVMIWAYFENKDHKKRTAKTIQWQSDDYNRRVKLMESKYNKNNN